MKDSGGVSRRDFGLGFVAASVLSAAAWVVNNFINTVGEDVGESLGEGEPSWLPEQNLDGDGYEPAKLSLTSVYDSYEGREDHRCKIIVEIDEWNDDRWLVGHVPDSEHRAVWATSRNREDLSGEPVTADVLWFSDGESVVISSVDPESENVTTHEFGTAAVDEDAESCEVDDVE